MCVRTIKSLTGNKRSGRTYPLVSVSQFGMLMKSASPIKSVFVVATLRFAQNTKAADTTFLDFFDQSSDSFNGNLVNSAVNLIKFVQLQKFNRQLEFLGLKGEQ